MKITITIFITFTISFLHSQTLKQITFSDKDCRNPIFIQYPANMPYFYPGDDSTEVIFEQTSGSSINLFSTTYDISIDSFYNPIQLTDNNFINRNADCKFLNSYAGPGYKLLIWETNQSGNWDIDYSADSGNGWSVPQFLFNSQQNETNSKFVFDPLQYYYDSVQIVYQKENSVYFYSGADLNGTSQSVFTGGIYNNYSSPAAAVDPFGNLYIVSVKTTLNNPPSLVYKKRLYDGSWSSELILYDSLAASAPRFFDNFDLNISFNVIDNGKMKVMLLNSYEFGNNSAAEPIVTDNNVETSEFSNYVYYIITDQEYWSPYPYAYRLFRNDSAFVVTGVTPFKSSELYKEIFTKVRDTKVAIGPLGGNNNGEISYTVWEDSSGSSINLFGVKRIDILGAADENKNITPDKIHLYQNYPNPFNPSTNFKYSIPDVISTPTDRGRNLYVTLTVYDILGREVATLVNEEKKPGTYEVKFDGNRLSSGIYFYRLKAGSFIQTKKMILLK